MALFKDRYDAGRQLARILKKFRDENVVILALPRGGVPVAFEVAKYLDAEMDIFLVKKIGVPKREELAMGAIATGGVRILNKNIIDIMNISDETIEETSEKEKKELERREKKYRDERPFPSLKNKTAILIDDGLATGASMRAAIKALRELNPAKIVVAVPTASQSICREFESETDEIICAYTPVVFKGVGEWYEDFSQTTDDEVIGLISMAKSSH